MHLSKFNVTKVPEMAKNLPAVSNHLIEFYLSNNLTHLCLATLKGTLANSTDPDQTPRNAASDLGLHCFN